MHIEDANGKAFKVGLDCVNKLARQDNAKRDPIIVAVNDARRKVQRDKRHEREAALITELTENYEAHYGWINACIIGDYNGTPQTVAMRTDWFLANAGNRSKIERLKEVCRIISALRVMGTPTDALRRPVASSGPGGPGRPLLDSEKRYVRDFVRDIMCSEYGHSKHGGWVDAGIQRYVAFALETYPITATEAEIEEIEASVPWEKKT